MIYDCKNIIDGINSDLEIQTRNYLSSRSRSNLRKNSKECVFREVQCSDADNIDAILKIWAIEKSIRDGASIGNMKDSILKDVMINAKKFGVHAFIGLRDKLPISLTLLAPIHKHPDTVSVITCKSLNYSSQPGGYNETSVWELLRTCEACISMRVNYMNVSGYDNINLKYHKDKFADLEKTFFVYDWST